MSIRSTCKAIIIDDKKILLNRCYDSNNGYYYSLPGGGQDMEEFMEEAVEREVLEETGYFVKPDRLVGIGEEICEDDIIRRDWPHYVHKIYHIYFCSLKAIDKIEPTNIDDMQEDSIWIDINKIDENFKLLPKMVKENLIDMVEGRHPIFLESVRIVHNHG